MLINLSDVFTTENKSISKEVIWEQETVEVSGVTYSVLEKSPMKLVMKNTGKGQALISVNGTVEVGLSCDRCLKDVTYSFDLNFEHEVVSPEHELESDEDSEESFMEGYHLKVDELISSEIMINWPMKILCREDCKGICRICGKDLNTGTCGCDTFVPSPGLAGIKEIFNANKEV